MTMAKTAKTSSKILLFAGLLFLAAHALRSKVVPEQEELAQQKKDDDGVCLLSLRALTQRTLVADHAEAGLDAEVEEKQLLEDEAARRAHTKALSELQMHTAQGKKMKTWLQNQQKLNEVVEQSSDDFTTFLANARDSQGFCHAKLINAKRALDVLKGNVHEMTNLITGYEQDLAANTESLRVTTMNLKALQDEKKDAQDECNKQQKEAQDEYDKTVVELQELKDMRNPEWVHDIVDGDSSHLPRFSLAGQSFAYCGGNQIESA